MGNEIAHYNERWALEQDRRRLVNWWTSRLVAWCAARWLVPVKSIRSLTRVWGFFACFVSLLFSLGMSAYYVILEFYMD